MSEKEDIKDLPPEQRLQIVPIKYIHEGENVGIYMVISIDPKAQKIGLLDKAFKVQRIRPNGTVILKPKKLPRAN